MQLTRKQIHEQVYFYTLILIAISLPLSVFTSSMFMILLALNWVVEGRYVEKWKMVAGNRALQVFLLLYIIHIVGLIWSSDLAYALHDMKIKLPLLSLPILIASSVPLDKQQVNRILLFFTLAVFVASMASLLKLIGWLPGEVHDFRDLSLFMSHIRFSLMIVLALLISSYFLFVLRNSISRTERLFYLLCLIWFPVSLALLKSLSGLFIAGFLAFYILLRLVFEIRDQVIRYMVLVPVLMIPLFSILYLGSAVDRFYSFDPMPVEELDSHTIEGNAYINKPGNREVENGHYTWIYVCDEELERDWNAVSSLDYRGRTSNGNSVRSTLIRFLTSKGLRKDAAGMRQLSETEIRAIERGTANHIYMDRFKLYPRIYEVIWEIERYKLGYNPNEKSVVQRYLYLEAGKKIAREHLWFGVGNGDVENEFLEYYESVQSPLSTKWRLRAHNQFLTFLISFGIPGLLICLLALIVPPFLADRQRSFLAMGFLILILVSMLSEDTLETARGASFAAFFYALFIFGPDFPWLPQKSQKADG
jgi:hypothetical protein